MQPENQFGQRPVESAATGSAVTKPPAALPAGLSRVAEPAATPQFARARSFGRPTSHALALAAALGMLVALLAAALYLPGAPLARLDLALAASLGHQVDASLIAAMAMLTRLGDSVVIAALSGAACLVLLLRGRLAQAVFVLLLVATGYLFNSTLKLLVHRPRPVLLADLAPPTTYSFPSGHAFGTTALVVSLFLVWIGSRRRSGLARAVAGCIAALWVVLMGASRVLVGAHYLSDVIAGTLLAVAWAALWSGCLACPRQSGRALPEQ